MKLDERFNEKYVSEEFIFYTNAIHAENGNLLQQAKQRLAVPRKRLR